MHGDPPSSPAIVPENDTLAEDKSNRVVFSGCITHRSSLGRSGEKKRQHGHMTVLEETI